MTDTTRILLIMLLCAAAGTTLAADPVVSNVQLAQRTDGSRLVDITYDLADADTPQLAVAVQFSADGGATWSFPALNLTGDLGAAVSPGTGRHVVWNAGALPNPQDRAGLKVRIVASDRGILHTPHSPGNVAIIDWSAVDWADPANWEKYSRADVCMVMAAQLWGDQYRDTPVIPHLKALNPDLKVFGYISAKSAQLSGEPAGSNAFWHDWFVRTRPFWVYTTTGDTAQDWPANVLVNILDPACRSAMVHTVADYQRRSANHLDGIMWDYFNNSLWVYSGIPSVTGDPDMDGDGIGHWADSGEMEAYRGAEVALVSAMRDSLGAGFIQIFNGQRGYSDAAFAGLADGLLYEIFPTLGWPQPNMRNAMDPAVVNSLPNVRGWVRTDNGGPWLILSNPWINRYQDLNNVVTTLNNGNVNRVTALLTDVYVAWHAPGSSTFSYTYGWTDNDICLGEPLGPAVHEGEFVRRDFQYGRVELEWKTGRYPDPFHYRIWSEGQLVEELDVPYHLP